MSTTASAAINSTSNIAAGPPNYNSAQINADATASPAAAAATHMLTGNTGLNIGMPPHSSQTGSQYHLVDLQQHPVMTSSSAAVLAANAASAVTGATLNKALTISNQVSLVYDVHDWWSEQVVGGTAQLNDMDDDWDDF